MKWYSCILIVLAGIIRGGILYSQTQPQPEHTSHNEHAGGHSNEGFCAADWLRSRQNAAATAREQQINRLLYDIFSRGDQKERSLLGSSADEIHTIPVVIHIIHNDGAENISDAQVLAGIEHMNQAFANIGVYDPSSGVSVGIQFCLAKRDPSGAATTGITRTRSLMTDLLLEPQDIEMKDLSRWDPQQYLNIWLVREITSVWVGSGVAGYAYFPTSHGGPEDGIVGEADRFGSTPANSAVYVHEAGHYLGLYHTFQGGCRNNNCLADGDQVCDTPPDATTAPIPCTSSFNSCTTDDDDNSSNNPFRSVASGGLGDQNDLFIDYMDYGNLECYSVFTQGQKDRMRAVLTEVRKSLLQSKGCMRPCTTNVIASFTASALVVDAGATVTFTNASTDAVSYEWLLGGTIFSTNINSSYTFTTEGKYIIKLRAFSSETGCTDEHEITIEVTCPARASFTADKRVILPGGSVTFTNTSSGATSYEWLVGGISIGTGTNFQHLFSTAGGYYVVLIASNGACRDTSAPIFIRVGVCDVSKPWNIWYFGNGAGLDFNNGAPVGITNGALVNREGVASICDQYGNILFYSDGRTIWNKAHVPMLGGSGLNGHTSFGSAQGAVIVPMPMSTSLYYLFTTNNWTDGTTQLRYSIIDMTLDGGLGGVTGIRNVVLNNRVSERVVAKARANCRDIWILSHEQENNRFVAYLLTPNGLVTTPVVSAVGSVSTGANRYGYLKFSHDGKRVSSTLGGSTTLPTVELFDFDDNTGQVSNPIVLADANELSSVMSSEFSPNNRFLYTANFTEGRVFQFDLAAGNAAAIRASGLQVANSGKGMACFQLGPDGRIYIVRDKDAFLSMIQYPNLRGAACGFVENGIDLKGRTGEIGLPNYVVGYIPRGISITGPQNICISDSVQTFTVASNGCSNALPSYRVAGNAEIIEQTTTSVRVRMKDVGNVMLIGERVDDCGLVADTLRMSVSVAPEIDLGADTAICAGNAVVLDAGPGFGSYRWQDGSGGQTYTTSGPGTYWVEVTLGGGCIGRDTIQVFPSDDDLSVNLGPDRAICEGTVAVLDGGFRGISYRWQDGSTGRRFTAFGPGTYWVEVFGRCGRVVDTVVITAEAGKLDLGSDTALCSSASLLLDAGVESVSYRWQDGSAGRTFTAPGPGIYWVEAILSSGCIGRDTIQVLSDNGSASMGLGPDTTLCPGKTLVLEAAPGALSYRWQDGSTGRTFTAPGPGIYWVEGLLSSGCTGRDTIEILPDDGNLSIALGPDTTLCPGATLVLEAPPGALSYRWQDGSTGRQFSVLQPGKYWVEALTECGGGSDTIEVLFKAATIDLGADTTICGTIDLMLDAGPGFTSYQWQDGSTAQTLHVTAPGVYQVRARSGECEVVESIRIDEGDDAAVFTAYLADIPSGQIAPGTQISIPLRVAVQKGALTGVSYRAVIRFNNTLLFPIGETPQGEIQGKEKVITITGRIGESDTVALLRFLALLGDAPQTPIVIDTFQVDGFCETDVTRLGGAIAIEFCEVGSSRLLRGTDGGALKVRMSYPAGSIITIDYRLIEHGPTMLYLANALGEKVKVLFNEEKAAGNYLSQVDARELEAGMYFVIIETPTQRMLEKVMVEK